MRIDRRRRYESLKEEDEVVKHSLYYYCLLDKAILAVSLKQAADFRLSHYTISR